MKKQTLKQIRTSVRKKQVQEGFFDGRFVERTVPNKKKQKDKKFCRLRIILDRD